MDVFEADPLLGAGANTFEVARKRYRDVASSVTQPHSVPLQFLAGTGVVGLALLLALAAAVAAAAVVAVRRLEGGERDAAAALAVALALWLVHALVDYPWDFVAVTGPAFFAAGVLAAAGRPPSRVRSPLLGVAAVAVALACCASVATPWLSRQAVLDVNPALDRGDVSAARDAAERARSLDPLSLDPLLARARVEEDAGDAAAALAAYRRAADLQPENPASWYELGLYEFSRGDRCSAYVHLNRAYTLDPAGTQWTPDSALVKSLAWVNAGNC
jgi:O-antigen ligase